MSEDAASQRLALARSRAFADFNRELGPRISKRRTQELIGSYLDDPAGGREALAAQFTKFPAQVQAKALQLLERYSGGLVEPDGSGGEVDSGANREKLMSEYRSALEPDASGNAWIDRGYEPRYSGNPIVEKFLVEKKDLLQRRGDYIQAQAAEGNIEPYARHNAWLRKQGVLPGDAESVKAGAEGWLTRVGLDDSVGKFAGYPHEAYSHAFAEKYMGKVDKSMPNAVTGADETRATMIDELTDTEALDSSMNRGIDPAIYDEPTPASPLVRGTQELARVQGDSEQEAAALAERFIKRSKELGLKDQYGVDWDESIALPGDGSDSSYGDKMTIKDRFRRAAEKRYPSADVGDIVDLQARGLLPYARDVDVSDRLSLRRQAERGIEAAREKAPRMDRIGTPPAIEEMYGRVYDNTYFSADPVTAAVKGGMGLARENLTGLAAGAAMAATNPGVASSVERGDYGKAAKSVARDTALGAATEAGVRAIAPVVHRVAPAAVRVAGPALRAAGPIGAGVALFDQGRTGSLTDVVTKKAAKYVPGLRPDPKTDLGRKAGNELMYMFNSLRRGRLPYQ